MPDMQGPVLLPARFADWFASRGWAARAHQLEMIAAAQAGEDALLIAPTGGGKTLGGFLPSLIELAETVSQRPGKQRPPNPPSPYTQGVSNSAEKGSVARQATTDVRT